MLGAGDHVYLTDFGLAKTLEQSGMTQTGAVIGTPYYMSPEQVKGEPAGPRSDIYSLGIILYEMVTGVRALHGGNSVYEVMIQRLQKPPRPPRELNPEIPGYLEKILERCLAIDPTLRYQTVREILTDLDVGHLPTDDALRAPAAALAPAGGRGARRSWPCWASPAWWLRGRLEAVGATGAPSKPESVLITDFVNNTGDPVFDGTLEPRFGLALEGASFLTSYNRGQARKIAAQLQPGATSLTEALGRLVAVREGIQIVTAGSIETSGCGLPTRATRSTRRPASRSRSEEATAQGKDAVLASVAKLATGLRSALGDTTPKSLQLAAAETYTAGSLEAAHEYALAQDLQYGGKYDEAIPHYLKAIERDAGPRPRRMRASRSSIRTRAGRTRPRSTTSSRWPRSTA